VLPRHIAWTSGWIRVEACGPRMWTPSNRRVAGSAKTLTKLAVSSSAQRRPRHCRDTGGTHLIAWLALYQVRRRAGMLSCPADPAVARLDLPS
jgi:hypothetical protein